MNKICCTNSSACLKVVTTISVLAVATAIALAIIFRQDVAHYAKKLAHLYTKGPLKVRIPLIVASSAVGALLLFCTAKGLRSCCRRKSEVLPPLLTHLDAQSYPSI